MMGDVVRNDSAALDQSYLECERIANESSSSFLRAFRTLPKEREMASRLCMPFAEGLTMLQMEIGCLTSQILSSANGFSALRALQGPRC